jgi:hypothetical protein
MVTIYTIRGTNIPHVFPSLHVSAWWGHLHVHWGFTIAFFLFDPRQLQLVPGNADGGANWRLYYMSWLQGMHMNQTTAENALLQLPSTQFAAQIYHTFSLHYMFRPDGAIFSYIGVLQSPFSFLLLSPHWPVFTHWECVVCMVLLCPFCKICCLWDI